MVLRRPTVQRVPPASCLAGKRTENRAAIWLGSLAGIAAVGLVDYATGTELRVYPLYFGPIALLAWHAGLPGAVCGAALSAAAWVCFNTLAGMRFTTDVMWAANTAVHGTSFVVVGLLIARLRNALAKARELSRTDPLTLLRNSRAFYEDTVPLLPTARLASHGGLYRPRQLQDGQRRVGPSRRRCVAA
jgi:hypothetical protein